MPQPLSSRSRRPLIGANTELGMRLSPRTLSTWLTEYKPLTTYARLRSHALTRFTPHTLIRSTRLHHKQVYMYRVHQGKLELRDRKSQGA